MRLAAAYLACVGLILLWPNSVTAPFVTQLTQLRSVVPYGNTLLEIAANVALFIPFGAFAAWLLPVGSRWLGVAAAIAVSSGAEIAQAMLLPDRVASVRDVAANSIGAAVGVLLVVIAARRSARPGHPGDTA